MQITQNKTIAPGIIKIETTGITFYLWYSNHFQNEGWQIESKSFNSNHRYPHTRTLAEAMAKVAQML